MSPSPTSYADSPPSDFLSGLADRFDPPEVDVFGILGYTPTAKQAEFHEASEFDVGYGGAAGGGKTKALLLHGIRACVRHPGLRVGAFRRTYDELAESFLKELALIDFARELGARWNGTERELRFPNTAVIRFRYLETIQDATRRQGGEYQLVLIDERTMIPPEAVSIVVDERIRSGSTTIPVLGVRSATNPGSIGHAAFKARYVDATNHGARTYTDEQGRTVRFVPAKVDDNPHVDAGYKARLDAIADPARRAAMKDGSWDSFAGQFFAEWSRERHVVRPFEIPAGWTRYAGIDYGYAAPWAVEWAAVDEDGRAWVYRERYETQVIEREQAKKILRAEGAIVDDDGLLARHPTEKVRIRAADPSMWAKKGEANTVADTYALAGCPVTPAVNDRLIGWQRVHTYLGGHDHQAEAPACFRHREQGWDTCPLIHVFDTCADLIRTLPALPHDQNRAEDVDTDAEDHAADALRYLLMILPQPKARREARTQDDSHQARMWRQLDKKQRGNRRPTPYGA